MNNNNELTQKEKKQISKQRKIAAKEAQKYHKEQEKRAKTSSSQRKKQSSSKIEEAVNSRRTNYENISREERYMRESEEKIRNLRPHDFSDGYYIDEYGARQRQQRRAKEIHNQEAEVIHRPKKPLTKKQIRLRRAAVYSAIFAVVLVVGLILSLTVLFKTEKIEVEGNEYYYDDQIISFSGVQYQQNIFIEALSADCESIVKNLPYIENADVSFSVPDTIIIKITNAVPTYVIQNGSEYLIISASGRIVDSTTENKDKLPLLKCEKLKSTKIGEYVSFSDENIPEILKTVSDSLQANKVKNITAFDVTDTANIMLVYDDRITINLGLPEDIDYKIRTAVTIIENNLDPNKTGTVEGVLDVSSCNTNKISRFKPADTEQTTTVPAEQTGTQPSTQTGLQTETSQSYEEYQSATDAYSDSYVWSESSQTVTEGNYYQEIPENSDSYTDIYSDENQYQNEYQQQYPAEE